MKTIIPDYYLSFHCLAGFCRHSCCMEGWEIEIDDQTVKKYRKVIETEPGSFSEKLKDSVYFPGAKERKSGSKPHIKLTGGICPFLTDKRLCELILTKSDQFLCQICRDHPRFINHCHDHYEMGIGMACEEAVRLILTQKSETVYLDLKTGNREQPCHLQDRKKSALVSATINSDEEAQDLVKLLERLDIIDPAFANLRKKTVESDCRQLMSGVKADADLFYRYQKQLKEYYCYRYLEMEGSGFVSALLKLLKIMTASANFGEEIRTEENFIELCRSYSSEIEYSTENLEEVRNFSKRS